jgi:hypothetical protein
MAFCSRLAAFSATGPASSPVTPISGRRALEAPRPSAMPVHTSTDQHTLRAASATSGRTPPTLPSPTATSSRTSWHSRPSRIASQATRSSVARTPADAVGCSAASRWEVSCAAALLVPGARAPSPESVISPTDAFMVSLLEVVLLRSLQFPNQTVAPDQAAGIWQSSDLAAVDAPIFGVPAAGAALGSRSAGASRRWQAAAGMSGRPRGRDGRSCDPYWPCLSRDNRRAVPGGSRRRGGWAA